jgi:hypothetical protein
VPAEQGLPPAVLALDGAGLRGPTSRSWAAAGAVLTGSRRIATSLDPVVARSIAGDTPQKALHLALSRPNGGSGFDWISYSEGGTANQGALDPRAMFQALIIESTPAATGAAPATDPTRDARRSVLDAVIKDATPFRASLDVADRQRCDQHLAYVRELERRLAALGAPSPATGNLLDRAAVPSTTCVSDGQSHSTSKYPILVAGKAGGELKGGVSVRASGPVTRAPLTVARAVGAPLTELGTDSLSMKDGLGELAT